MEVVIDSGYIRKCKDAQGGVSEVYLFPYVDYLDSQIVTLGNILTSFPTTTIYKFYTNNNPNANESQEKDAGGKFYNQAISVDLVYKDDFENILKFLKKDYRLIFKDRVGNYRIFGLYNSLFCDSVEYTTGSSKSDFNGFKLSFNGKEEKQSFFITNLEDTGFILETEFRILENGDFRILENNDFRILE